MSANQLVLAASAVEIQKISQRNAARLYNVSHASLNRYITARTNKNIADLKRRKLQPSEEAALVQWILSMDRRGLPPRPSIVRSMANLLLEKRGDGNPEPIGPNWVTRFLGRHEEIKSKFVRKFDYKRALCESPKIIQDWFTLVREITEEYEILPDDTYNMDETGFAMGMIATCMAITSSDRSDRPRLLQSGNRAWSTVVNTINALGWALDPMFILKGKTVPSYEDKIDLPSTWIVKSSPNGWTDNEFGLFWIKEVFDKQTRPRTKGQYRLLIMDGHGSHATPELDTFCMENQIILLYMPPHSSHLLQPLDVSCFGPLKRSYGQKVENQIRCGINHVDKLDFLHLYREAHFDTFTEQTIQSGFKATGLVPYDPQAVLSKLQMSTPSPTTSHGSESSWTSQTPQDVAKIQKQSAHLRNRMQHRTEPLSSPTNQLLDKLFFNYEKLMVKNVLLTQENVELKAANAKQQRKRKSTYVPHGGAARRVRREKDSIPEGNGDLSQETNGNFVRRNGDDLVQRNGNLDGDTNGNFVRRNSDDSIRIANGEYTQEADNQPVHKKRAPNRCSVCRALEHTARNCPRLG